MLTLHARTCFRSKSPKGGRRSKSREREQQRPRTSEFRIGDAQPGTYLHLLHQGTSKYDIRMQVFRFVTLSLVQISYLVTNPVINNSWGLPPSADIILVCTQLYPLCTQRTCCWPRASGSSRRPIEAIFSDHHIHIPMQYANPSGPKSKQ